MFSFPRLFLIWPGGSGTNTIKEKSKQKTLITFFKKNQFGTIEYKGLQWSLYKFNNSHSQITNDGEDQLIKAYWTMLCEISRYLLVACKTLKDKDIFRESITKFISKPLADGSSRKRSSILHILTVVRPRKSLFESHTVGSRPMKRK